MLKKNKKLIASIAVAALASVLTLGHYSSASALEAWGPVRDTYTLAHPANEAVFNSITDNHNTTADDPKYVGDNVVELDETIDYTQSNSTTGTASSTSAAGLGDERNFVRIRKADTNDYYDDVVLAVPGEEYEVYVYFHNNAAPGSGLNAYNTILQVESPESLNRGETAVVKGTISWAKENGEEAERFNVWDSTFIKATEPIHLRYVPNSAVIHNGNTEETTANGQILNDDALWGDGAFLAYDIRAIGTEGRTLWGLIPPCNNYAGYVTFRLKADQAKFYMEKEVSADGEKDWKDTITAAPGDTLHFRIHYKNTGTVNQMKINAKDTLPETMTYITTTNTEDPSRNVEIKWTSGVIGQEPVYDKVSLMVKPGDFFGGSGVVVGDYKPNEEFYYYYDVKLASAESFEQCSTDIWNKAQIATFDGTEHDSVKVTVVKDCSTPDVPEELPDTGLGKVAGIVSIVLGGSACVYLVCMSKAFRKN